LTVDEVGGDSSRRGQTGMIDTQFQPVKKVKSGEMLSVPHNIFASRELEEEQVGAVLLGESTE